MLSFLLFPCFLEWLLITILKFAIFVFSDDDQVDNALALGVEYL